MFQRLRPLLFKKRVTTSNFLSTNAEKFYNKFDNYVHSSSSSSFSLLSSSSAESLPINKSRLFSTDNSTAATTASQNNGHLKNNGEVLYEADRARLFKAASAFSIFNFGWWISLAGVDITNFFGGEGEIMTNIFDSTGFTVAPELTSVGTLCSIAIVALVKFYSSKNVGLIVLDPSATKVMIATHNMLGNLVPREVSVNSFTKSPHASSQYHLFKIEDDSWYTMVDRNVGTFHNESKLIRMLEGRIAGQIVVPTRSVLNNNNNATSKLNSSEIIEEENTTNISKRAAQNKMRKQRKKQTRR
jgi:hypothetical protein